MDSLFPGRRTTVAIHSERPRAAGKPCLIVISGPGLGERRELGEDDTEIGRSESCTLCINSDQVSRRHANVLRIAGRYVVTDLGSTNGTFVNESKIKTTELRDGDQIRIGRTVIKYTESRVESEYFEHIMSLASEDALTGAYNKRKFDELFAAEVARSAQGEGPFCFALFDIDFFKRINDQFGHPAGDAVLKGVSELARGIVGHSGSLCRVGGEEFAVLLPGLPLLHATKLAEYLREAVQRHQFSFENRAIPVTISGGLAELAPGETGEGLYKRTDELLYRSKHGGRNRITS
jgi:diguanylate cyclase (GGDEF)-like protein